MKGGTSRDRVWRRTALSFKSRSAAHASESSSIVLYVIRGNNLWHCATNQVIASSSSAAPAIAETADRWTRATTPELWIEID